jgi:hypothetical protein
VNKQTTKPIGRYILAATLILTLIVMTIIVATMEDKPTPVEIKQVKEPERKVQVSKFVDTYLNFKDFIMNLEGRGFLPREYYIDIELFNNPWVLSFGNPVAYDQLELFVIAEHTISSEAESSRRGPREVIVDQFELKFTFSSILGQDVAYDISKVVLNRKNIHYLVDMSITNEMVTEIAQAVAEKMNSVRTGTDKPFIERSEGIRITLSDALQLLKDNGPLATKLFGKPVEELEADKPYPFTLDTKEGRIEVVFRKSTRGDKDRARVIPEFYQIEFSGKNFLIGLDYFDQRYGRIKYNSYVEEDQKAELEVLERAAILMMEELVKMNE